MTEAQLAANRANALKGGRPAGKLNEATIRRNLIVDSFRDKVASRLDELLELAMANARGVIVAKTLPGKIDEETGKQEPDIIVDVYKKAPDQVAIRDLIRMLVPEPPKSIELDANVDSTNTVVHEYTDDKPKGGGKKK